MNSGISETVCDRIRRVRVLRGYSQSQAAEIMGITQQAYAEKEKSGADLRISSLFEICTAFQVEPAYLLSRSIPINNTTLEYFHAPDHPENFGIQEILALREKVQKMKLIIREQRSLIDHLSS